MGASSFVLLLFSLGALALLWWKGRTPERIASAAFVIAMFGTPLVEGYVMAGIRVGVAGLAIGLATTLTVLALRTTRWWLIAAAGIQVLSIATYGAALVSPDSVVWALVTVRYAVWTLLMMLAVFGAVESRLAPYAQT